MRKLAYTTLTASLLVVAPSMGMAQNAAPEGAQRAYEDIEQTLGLVPSFLKVYPEEGVAAAWEMLKSFQLNPDTALPGKTKELIGLGVAAQIPCDYCVYFHKQAAKLDGATEDEIREAVAMAAATRGWSTILNGALIDLAEFQRETDRIFEFVQAAAESGGTPAAAQPVTDAETAYADMERVLGTVPGYMRRLPETAVAGAWKLMGAVEDNPDTALSGKAKQLIGLAVAAQIPCHYCAYYHTEAAKLSGASEEEVDEALGMAALTRHFSTVLNGMDVDEAAFRQETDRIMQHVEASTRSGTN